MPVDREIVAAVAALGDRIALEAVMRRLDERALCFDPDPEHRKEVKRRLREGAQS